MNGDYALFLHIDSFDGHFDLLPDLQDNFSILIKKGSGQFIDLVSSMRKLYHAFDTVGKLNKVCKCSYATYHSIKVRSNK